MPYKNKEDRNARCRQKHAELLKDPDWAKKKKEAAAEWFRNKYKDPEFKAQRKAYRLEWYSSGGKEQQREKKGQISREEWLKLDKDEKQAKQNATYAANQSEKHRRSIVAKAIRVKYGLPIDDYDLIYNEQAGCCRICGGFRPRYERTRLAVDHCHERGHVRGLLCTDCNLGIGNFAEDVERLEKAISYLREVAIER